MTETVTIRLGKTTKAALQALADSDHRKLASYLTLVLQRHVEQRQQRQAEKPKRGGK